MYDGLKEYVKFLEEKGELRRIREFVDPVLEIACATDIESKKPGGGKALLFENTGTAFPVLTNAMGSEARIRYALGAEPQEAGDRLMEAIDTLFCDDRTLRGKWKMLQVFHRLSALKPRLHKGHAPCQDVVQYAAQLSRLPVLKEWPQDNGRFLTLPHIYSCNPLTGMRHAGYYRLQPIDDTTASLLCPDASPLGAHLADCTHRLPVAVCLGGDPVYSWIASTPMPDTIDPFLPAAFLHGKPVEMAKCFTQDLLIPADCDFVIEGYIQKSEEKVAGLYPKFHVTCISHRFDAICPASVPGSHSSEFASMQEAGECIFQPLRRRFQGPTAEELFPQEPGGLHADSRVYPNALTDRMTTLLND